MKILSSPYINNTKFAQYGKISAQNNTKDVYADSSVMFSYLNFLGNCNKPVVQKSVDIPIENDDEFREVMERVYDAKTENGNELWLPKNYRDVFITYRHASDIEMGLIPYCGEADNSEFINMYLSGRLQTSEAKNKYKWLLPADFNSCIDVVRALDYSLNNLDKEFGTYKGLVYRRGYMDEGNGQFYSTTRNLSSINRRFLDCNNFDPKEKYSVIRLKDGHKIYEFQEKMGSTYAESEEEVLTQRNAKFKKVAPEDMDEELLKGREQLAANLFWEADKIIYDKADKPTLYTREQLLNMIDVYDEI